MRVNSYFVNAQKKGSLHFFVDRRVLSFKSRKVLAAATERFESAVHETQGMSMSAFSLHSHQQKGLSGRVFQVPSSTCLIFLPLLFLAWSHCKNYCITASAGASVYGG